MSKRGIVMFAHNNGKTDYYRMAVYSAKRANRFYDLPVTIITDSNSVKDLGYSFDNTILIEPDSSNSLRRETWINKGRHQVYDLSPYDETLVLDTDYMINSQELLKTFYQPSDFMCYRTAKHLLEDTENERMGQQGIPIYWATVMRFNRSNRCRDIFKMIEMVQNNYQHYADLHNFLPYTYRNDYALTIALRTVNGHLELPQDFIIGRLIHAGLKTRVNRVNDTTYDIINEVEVNGTIKQQCIKIKDFDFHLLRKDNFMELAV